MPIITDPEQVVPDIVAFSGQRAYAEHPANGSRQEMVDAIVDTCTLAGWEVTATTSQTNGTGYTIRSQQSPWYNIDKIPAWYIGNKIIVEIDMTQASSIRVRVGADYGGTTVHKMSAGEFFSISDALSLPYARFILANPYQLITWLDRDPTGIGNPHTFGDLLISALNNPKNMLQKNKIIHNIIATPRLRAGNTDIVGGSVIGSEYVCYRTRDTAGSYSFLQTGFNVMTPVGGRANRQREGRRIWNRGLDPTMSDVNNGSPFFVPPYVLGRLPGSSTTTVNGFLWDSFVITEGFSVNAKIDKSERRWGRFCGSSLIEVNNVGSTLFFNTDENLPEE